MGKLLRNFFKSTIQLSGSAEESIIYVGTIERTLTKKPGWSYIGQPVDLIRRVTPALELFTD